MSVFHLSLTKMKEDDNDIERYNFKEKSAEGYLRIFTSLATEWKSWHEINENENNIYSPFGICRKRKQ